MSTSYQEHKKASIELEGLPTGGGRERRGSGGGEQKKERAQGSLQMINAAKNINRAII